MARAIRISAGSVQAAAELNESATATQVWNALPIEAAAQTWGDEIYFGIPPRADEEKDARAVVQLGDLGYWPPGAAFCISSVRRRPAAATRSGRRARSTSSAAWPAIPRSSRRSRQASG